MGWVQGSLFTAALMGAIFHRLLASGADQSHDFWRLLVAGFLGAAAAWCVGWTGNWLAERRRLRRLGRR